VPGAELLWQLLAIVHVGVALIVILDLLGQHRSHGATIAWIAILLLLPYAGLALYFLAGAPRKHGQRLTRQLQPFHSMPAAVTGGDPIASDLLRALHIPPATCGNRVDFQTRNEAAAEALLQVIRAARSELHVSVFSFEHDDTGDRIIRELADRARAGVAVYVLVDGYGSRELPRLSQSLLRRAGAQVAHFRPLLLSLGRRGSSNYRNGRNFANKYFRSEPADLAWADLSLTIEGPAAALLAAVCESDWAEAGGATARSAESAATRRIPSSAGESLVQILPSGPDLEDDTLHALLLTVFATARERIWIASPFFVPDDSLLDMLALACRRGVDVRVTVPQRSNQRFADWVRGSYLRRIAASGGRVLRYQAGMLHTKAIVVDERLAIVGSANADMRSLFTNHEICAILYDAQDIEPVASAIASYAGASEPGVAPGGFLTDVLGGALRLAAPLI
jgi:cardiolipin synthase A/B